MSSIQQKLKWQKNSKLISRLRQDANTNLYSSVGSRYADSKLALEGMIRVIPWRGVQCQNKISDWLATLPASKLRRSRGDHSHWNTTTGLGSPALRFNPAGLQSVPDSARVFSRPLGISCLSKLSRLSPLRQFDPREGKGRRHNQPLIELSGVESVRPQLICF